MMTPDVLALRAAVYRTLALAFTFPEPGVSARFRDGSWQQELLQAARGLGVTAPGALTLLQLDDETLETEFIALFEVGLGGAPCPLHSGHYGKERMITLEEVVRFYRFFEYAPARSGDFLPDHLATELVFVAHLAACQHEALAQGGDVLSPLRAQRDFVARHLASWLPELARRLSEKSDCAFFREVGAFAAAFVTADHQQLNSACAEDAHLNGARRHG